MDTQQILSSLASLRDNLSAIETARQQVQNNVAAYDKVRQQLADTSIHVSKILEDFSSLAKEIDSYQASISTDFKTASKEILNVLKGKAESISKESTQVVDTLKATLESARNELQAATNDAIKRIDDNTFKRDQNLETLFEQTNSQFQISTEATIKSFAKEIESLKKRLSEISEKFDKGLSAQLGRQSTSFNDHIGKCESLNQSLKNQIKDLEKQTEVFKDVMAKYEASLSKKIGKIVPDLTHLIDGLSGEIGNAKTEIISGIFSNVNSAYQKSKAELKNNNDAIKKRLDKLEDKIASNQTKTSAGIDLIIKSLQEQIDTITQQNKSVKKLMIVGYIVVALPILIILVRLFNFV